MSGSTAEDFRDNIPFDAPPAPSETELVDRVEQKLREKRTELAELEIFLDRHGISFDQFVTAYELSHRIKEKQEKRRKTGYKLIHISEMQMEPPQWLVKRFLQMNEFSEVFGDPGSGKTILAVDWACRVATGIYWGGLPVRQGPVVYICGEGEQSIRRRVRAWEIVNQEIGGAPLYILPHPIQLVEKHSLNMLMEAIQDLVMIVGVPLLIIFDTLSRCFGPGDESRPADMNLAIAAADQLRWKYKSTILYVHHPGHGDKTRGRSSSSLPAALDTDYRLEKDDQGTIRMEARKIKDGAFPEPKAFKLREVELGMQDEDGEEITSVVFQEVSYTPRPSEGKRGRGSQQLTMLELLNNLMSVHRENLEGAGRNGDGARVDLEEWRTACVHVGIPKATVYRNINVLSEQGKIRIEGGGHVYPLL